MRLSHEKKQLFKQSSSFNRECDKPRRKGLCKTASSIQPNIPLPFTTPTETFPITFTSSTTTPSSKLTSRTRVIFPTKNLSKWSQIVNNGTFAHSISNLLEKTKNKLSLKELSPSGQIHFVNMMNRDLTLMQTIELYTALTPHKFTLAYRLKFTVLPNGVYINFSMSQPSGSSAMIPSTSNSNQLNSNSSISTNTTTTTNVNNNQQENTNALTPQISESSSSSINANNNQPYSSTINSTSSAPPNQAVTRNGWALFQISREKDSNNSVLPNKIIEVAILM